MGEGGIRLDSIHQEKGRYSQPQTPWLSIIRVQISDNKSRTFRHFLKLRASLLQVLDQAQTITILKTATFTGVPKTEKNKGDILYFSISLYQGEISSSRHAARRVSERSCQQFQTSYLSVCEQWRRRFCVYMHRTVAHHCPGLWIVPRLSKNYVYENPQKKESVSNERSFRELLTFFLN